MPCPWAPWSDAKSTKISESGSVKNGCGSDPTARYAVTVPVAVKAKASPSVYHNQKHTLLAKKDVHRLQHANADKIPILNDEVRPRTWPPKRNNKCELRNLFQKNGVPSTNVQSTVIDHVDPASEPIAKDAKKPKKNSWMNSCSKAVNAPKTVQGIALVTSGANKKAAAYQIPGAPVSTRAHPCNAQENSVLSRHDT